MIIMAVAFVALPAMAQQEQWQSTSTMEGLSTYTAPITEVGSASAAPVATTTENSSQARAPKPRKSFDDTPNPGQGNPGSPVGDAALPLLVFAAAAAATVAIRNRRRQMAE